MFDYIKHLRSRVAGMKDQVWSHIVISEPCDQWLYLVSWNYLIDGEFMISQDYQLSINIEVSSIVKYSSEFQSPFYNSDCRWLAEIFNSVYIKTIWKYLLQNACTDLLPWFSHSFTMLFDSGFPVCVSQICYILERYSPISWLFLHQLCRPETVTINDNFSFSLQPSSASKPQEMDFPHIRIETLTWTRWSCLVIH